MIGVSAGQRGAPPDKQRKGKPTAGVTREWGARGASTWSGCRPQVMDGCDQRPAVASPPPPPALMSSPPRSWGAPAGHRDSSTAPSPPPPPSPRSPPIPRLCGGPPSPSHERGQRVEDAPSTGNPRWGIHEPMRAWKSHAALRRAQSRGWGEGRGDSGFHRRHHRRGSGTGVAVDHSSPLPEHDAGLADGRGASAATARPHFRTFHSKRPHRRGATEKNNGRTSIQIT